jgi:hypothetical protein
MCLFLLYGTRQVADGKMNIFIILKTHIFRIGLDLWCLIPLSTMFQLYRDGQFYTGIQDGHVVYTGCDGPIDITFICIPGIIPFKNKISPLKL